MIRRLPPVRSFLLPAIRVLCAWVLVTAAPGFIRAQAPAGGAADKLNQDGGLLFDQGRYKDAAAQYEALLKSYPNSEFATDAQFRLAYANFLLNQYQPAVDGLRKLLTSAVIAPELKEAGNILLAQVLAQQAGTLPEKDPKRTAGFQAAIKEYAGFIQNFPRSAQLESAQYGQAVAEFQIDQIDPAIADLRKNVAAFPRSESILDSEYLLALALAKKASLSTEDETKAAAPGVRDAAGKGYEEAQKFLNDIIAKRTQDIALANDAEFQLGGVLNARAGDTPGEARNTLLAQALEAYRAVEPKEPMVAAQTAQITRLTETRLAEARKGASANRNLLTALRDRIAREQGKLVTLQAKDDPVMSARIKCGVVFFQLGRYDETRVLLNALLSSATVADDQKQILYFLTLSYIAQNNLEKAVTAYDQFQSQYKGDPIAEQLPRLMGQLFLSGAKPDGAKAEHYFDEFAKLYPKSRSRDAALLEMAGASLALGRFDEALSTLDKFLKTNPKRELAASGEAMRAQVLRTKGDLPGALAAYKKVRDTYTDQPSAQEAAFGVGSVLLQSNDAAGAVNELKAFQTKYPQGRLLPNALVSLALAQDRTGAKDQALATLADVTGRFAQTPSATDAYFQRANIFLTGRKYDDMSKTLREFIDKNPASDRAYDAYQQIAAVQVQERHLDEAAKTDEDFVDKQPQSPRAPEALAKLAALYLRTARDMGSYIVLGAPQREVWKTALNNSVATSERELARYPEAPATALALQSLLDCQRLLIEAKVKTDDQVREYMQGLAGKYQDQPGAHSRILFGLASLTLQQDPAKALADMQAAYDPKVVYSPADVDRYTQLLLKNDSAAAESVFQKLAGDYPNPPGLAPAQAPVDVQEAQALVLYGRGKAAEAKGDKTKQEQSFRDLKKFYPQSPKVPEANLGLAEGLVAGGKPDEALPLLSDLARSSKAPLETRARGMLLFARVQNGKGQLPTSIDSYLKLAAFYPTTAEAPEGLWEGAQLLEKQAATLGDAPTPTNPATKATQTARARKAYQDLVTKYPDTKWVGQAKARLTALPPAK